MSTSSPVASVLECESAAGLGVDQLGVDEAACSQVHPVLLRALSPERRADVPDPHRLGHLCTPAFLELRPEERLAAAGLTGDENALDARAAEVEVTFHRPFHEVRGVRRRHRCRSGLERVDRRHQPLGVPGTDRDVAEPDAVERKQRRAGHERTGVVGGDDSLAGGDAGGGVAARRGGDPVLEVSRR